ncbi:MAG: DNA repair exonuclease, partial [Candidatus Desulfacyla sp.]
MFRFIHAADIHLDSPLRGLESYEDAPVAEIRGACRRAFDNLIDLAIEEEVRFILLAGDLYDGDWKDYHTGLYFIGRMGRLRQHHIRVFMVSGNHDAASQITRTLQLPDHVGMLSNKRPETVLLEDVGVAIHGQGYASRAVTENLAAGYPQYIPGYFNIGLLHTALTGRQGHEPYAPCTVDDLVQKGYDYWALGHVHCREEVSTDPWIVFPGNLQGRHARETGTKGASLVTVEDGQVTGVVHRELDVLRWQVCSVDLSGCGSMDAVHHQVRQTLEKEQGDADGRVLAVRLVLTGSSPVHAILMDESAHVTESFRSIAAGLGDMWLEKVLFRTQGKETPLHAVGRETPLAGLMTAVEAFDLDPGNLPEQVPEIGALITRLPADLVGGDDPLLPNTPEEMATFRQEVRELLAGKLIRHWKRS